MWAGRFGIYPGYSLYEGRIADSDPHIHAAYQLTIGLSGNITVDDGITTQCAPAFVIAPMARHRIAHAESARIYHVEPHTDIAAQFRGRYRHGINAAPELCALTERDLFAAVMRDHPAIDVRLRNAMTLIAAPDFSGDLTTIALAVNLSPQRLRALAQEQLGMPLARWRIWERLKRAVDAIVDGASLATAAQAGGFADQAHFTRDMKSMFGITPAAVLHLLRPRGGVNRN